MSKHLNLEISVYRWIKSILILALSVFLMSCLRGKPTTVPPIHLNPNMDDQPRYDAQESSPFFNNGREMQIPVEGTVALDELNEDDALYRGKDGKGKWVTRIPVNVNQKLMARGQERYNIFCAPCHGKTGDGKGIVVQKGFMPPPSYYQENVLKFDDGYIYHVITDGIRVMPDYKKQIPVHDRWAIVAYVRALQRTRSASKNDVPKNKLNELK